MVPLTMRRGIPSLSILNIGIISLVLNIVKRYVRVHYIFVYAYKYSYVAFKERVVIFSSLIPGSFQVLDLKRRHVRHRRCRNINQSRYRNRLGILMEFPLTRSYAKGRPRRMLNGKKR